MKGTYNSIFTIYQKKITTKETLMSVSHLMPGNNIREYLKLKGHRCYEKRRGPHPADGQLLPNAASAIPVGTTLKTKGSSHPSAQQETPSPHHPAPTPKDNFTFVDIQLRVDFQWNNTSLCMKQLLWFNCNEVFYSCSFI